MGYDDNECLFCYTSGNGNEITDKDIDICFTCLEKHIGSQITGRVLYIFCGDIVRTKINCAVCHEEKKLACHVKCCDDCQTHFGSIFAVDN
jgi:hypothetical protein